MTKSSCSMSVVPALNVIVVAYRCTAVQRWWTPKKALGWHFQPESLSTDLGRHSGPLLVRLAGAETHRSMGPQPFLHPWLVPVASQTHLPLGQTSDQAVRLVGCCKYAIRHLAALLMSSELYKLAFNIDMDYHCHLLTLNIAMSLYYDDAAVSGIRKRNAYSMFVARVTLDWFNHFTFNWIFNISKCFNIISNCGRFNGGRPVHRGRSKQDFTVHS